MVHIYIGEFNSIFYCPCLSTGVTEASPGTSNWFGSEANKQLVHKSKKTTLEAIRGHAIYGYECCTASSLLYEQCCGKSYSDGYIFFIPLNVLAWAVY